MGDEAPGRGTTDFPVGGGGPAPGPLPVPLQDQLFGCFWWGVFTDIEAGKQRDEFFRRTQDAGCNATESGLDNAWFDYPEHGHGGFVPWERANGSPAFGGTGPFDLTRKSEAFWDHYLAGVESAIAHGQVVQVKVAPNYYSCASHTQGALWVPDRDLNPRRYNIQGERLGDPDNDRGIHDYVGTDDDWVGNALIEEGCRRFKPYVERGQLYFCTALEMAQKELHVRVRDRILGHLSDAIVIANRQEWPTGMWRNMVRKTGFDGNEEHKKPILEKFLAEYDANNLPPTRSEMLAEARAYNPCSAFWSSDGCRIDKDPDRCYDYPNLEEHAVYILREFGGNWCQQSVSKMPQYSWGRVDLGPMDRNEIPMLKNIYRRWKA